MARVIVDTLHNGCDPCRTIREDLVTVLTKEGVAFATHEVWSSITAQRPPDQLLFRLASMVGCSESVSRDCFGYTTWQHLEQEIKGWQVYYSGARRNVSAREKRIESRAQTIFGTSERGAAGGTGVGFFEMADADEDGFGYMCDAVQDGDGVSSGHGIREATRKVCDPVVLTGLVANQYLHGQATGELCL